MATQVKENQDTRHIDAMCTNASKLQHPWWYNFKYTLVGVLLGIIFIKSEVISWFRIQEMFQLTSFYMYGVISTAILVGIISIQIIQKAHIKTIYGETITFEKKEFSKGQVFGGLIFGLGWAITGACPGPLYAQIGAGFGVAFITLLSAILGTWVYGYFREKLPH